jgi:hypothetical protein
MSRGLALRVPRAGPEAVFPLYEQHEATMLLAVPGL